jgi:hypothetical protein
MDGDGDLTTPRPHKSACIGGVPRGPVFTSAAQLPSTMSGLEQKAPELAHLLREAAENNQLLEPVRSWVLQTASGVSGSQLNKERERV